MAGPVARHATELLCVDFGLQPGSLLLEQNQPGLTVADGFTTHG